MSTIQGSSLRSWGDKSKGRWKRESEDRPDEVVADSAYDIEWIRRYLRLRGDKRKHTEERKGRINPRVGRPPRFEEKSYKTIKRGVERLCGWLKCGFRKLALRYERLRITFLGFLRLACFILSRKILR